MSVERHSSHWPIPADIKVSTAFDSHHLLPGQNRARQSSIHLSLRKLIAHAHGPDAGSGANVEDALRLLLHERGQKQLLADSLDHEDVHQVEAVQLGLVVGHGIHARPEGMVPAAVLDGVVDDARGQRGREGGEFIVPEDGIGVGPLDIFVRYASTVSCKRGQ